jgi:hypothetical protein
MSKKYYIYLSVIYLYLVPWFITYSLGRLLWLSTIFLVLLFLPMSYEEAIKTASVLKGFASLLKTFVVTGGLSVIVLLLYLFFHSIRRVYFPGSFDSLDFSTDTQAITSWFVWFYASFNAVRTIVIMLRKGEEEETESN